MSEEGSQTIFHQALKAAVLLGVPIRLGHAHDPSLPSGNATAAKLAELQNVVPSTASIRSKLPSQYAAALAAFDSTASMPIVLKGLSIHGYCHRQLAQLLRSSATYLLILFSLGSFGLCFFRDLVTPSFVKMRQDLELPPAMIVDTASETTHWLTFLLVLMLVAIVVTAAVRFLGGTYWLAFWVGGRRFRNLLLAATAAEVSRAMLLKGVTLRDSVSIALDLVDANTKQRTMIQSSTVGLSEQSAVGSLGAIADNFQSAADDRLVVMKVALPMILVFCLGGAAVLAYCLALFMPLVMMIRDLAVPTSL
ncbi:hypothetical protein CA13_42050 [Planctomycetes bacterium CA13]|uniref:Bacterial type II secretion system protein F domain protein n=1 Tax=Novipirellula herctigrandis TaxID=2527986 RepID=A0A5C5Z604_9BACT|nr:hypothetical protein CA13_42050 [Planctomycetes bacterium CA13]